MAKKKEQDQTFKILVEKYLDPDWRDYALNGSKDNIPIGFTEALLEAAQKMSADLQTK